MVDDPSQVHLTGEQIRVLAHPLRVRLLGLLRRHGPSTATRLAGELETNTGATSYHLRQLAGAGLVAEQERPGGGRQRWWRAVHEMSSWRRSSYQGDPDATAAAEWLEEFQVHRFVELSERWRRGRSGEPVAWQDSGGISDYLVHLDHEQVDALMREVEEVVVRHERAAQADPRPGARRVAFYLAALPADKEVAVGEAGTVGERGTAGTAGERGTAGTAGTAEQGEGQ